MQELPIGMQSFESIRDKDYNYLYVDKTEKLLELAKTKKSYFLSRPRRFGKSLTVSTFEAMFQGKADLFKDLYAEEWVKEQAKHPNPVVTLDMSGFAKYKDSEGLNISILNYFERFLFLNDLNIPMKNNAGDMFANIITRLYKQFGHVVVLVDEYDFPITEFIDDIEKANEIRAFLRLFYLNLKTYSKYLRFVFITGISKFSKVGIFSGLNNLKDISMTKKYGDIVGYTQKELEDNFSAWIENTSLDKSINKQELLDKIKDYYDGFSFDGITRVYNPFSVLNFFDEGEFRNYWYDSATPSFLAKYLQNHKIKDQKEFIQKKVSINFTNSKEIENASVESFLYQSGYLTIFHKKGNIITLDYPNEEVRSSMSCLFLDNFYNINNYATLSDDIWESLEEENINKIVETFNKGLKGIPYDDYKDRDEYWYRSLFLMLLNVAKITYFAEVHTYQGRSDVVIVFNDKIVVIEFKLAKKSKDVSIKREEGEHQIQDRDYASAYANTNKKIITAVFVADDEKRQVIL